VWLVDRNERHRMTGGRTWLARRVVVYGVLVTLTAIFVACSADVRATELRVDVSGVRSAAHVVVSGPGGSRVFEHSDTWEVKPGRYLVKIEPVREGKATLRATESRLTVEVRAATVKEVRAAYRVMVPDYTRIADASNSPILSATDTEVTLKDGAYAADLRPGQVIASGATPVVAEAFAARVDSIRSGPDATRIATVVQVPMLFAMPRMVLRVESAPENRAYSLPRRAEDVDLFPGGPDGPSIEGESWTEVSMTENCSQGGPTLSYNLDDLDARFKVTEFEFSMDPGKIDVDLWPPSADVDLPKPKLLVRLETGVSGTAWLGIKAVSAFTCKAEKDLPGLELTVCKASARIPGLGGSAGPTCRLNQHFETSFSAASGFEFGAQIKLAAELTTEVKVGNTKPLSLKSRNPVTVPKVWGQMAPAPKKNTEVESEGTFNGGLLKTVGFSVGKGTGRLGVEFTEFISSGTKLTLDHLDGELTVDYRIGDEFGVELDFWGDRWDVARKVVPAWFTLPLAKWTFGEENRKMPTPPTGTVFYTQFDENLDMDMLYSKTGNSPAERDFSPGPGFAVSPDGQRTAWTDTSGGNGLDSPALLMISDLEGNGAREVTTGANGGGLCNWPAWAPDSRHVLFQKTATTATAAGRWALVNVDTGEEVMLDEPTGCYPVWSPDGTAIAWYDQESSEPTHANIRITDENGGNSRWVPHVQGVPDPCFNSVVALSPDGRRAVVDASQPDRRACGDGPARSNAVAGLVIDTVTGKVVGNALPGPIQTAVYLPDGRLLALLVGSKEFILLDQDLTVVNRLPEPSLGGGDITLLAYSPE
jgi:hypothetical protein